MRAPEAPSLVRLPEHVLLEILARVPGVADLFRCAAARKRWRDLVTEPSFLTPLAGGRVPLLLPRRLPRPGAAPRRGRAAGLQLHPRAGVGARPRPPPARLLRPWCRRPPRRPRRAARLAPRLAPRALRRRHQDEGGARAQRRPPRHVQPALERC
uniref:F-box domain-containing protein n=1 Tax=Aegilops tauschii subsp. strangulata TaxID=200361 RepID=A0A453TAQ9_AEGTS